MPSFARVREEPRDAGTRILLDRLWPRGLSKEKARVDLWAKDYAPSNALRTWYHKDPEASFEGLELRYLEELDELERPPWPEPVVLLTDARAVERCHLQIFAAWWSRGSPTVA